MYYLVNKDICYDNGDIYVPILVGETVEEMLECVSSLRQKGYDPIHVFYAYKPWKRWIYKNKKLGWDHRGTFKGDTLYRHLTL